MRFPTTLKKAWSGYNSLLTRRPLGTQSFVSCTLFTIGDLVAQSVQNRKSRPQAQISEWTDFDFKRTLRMSAFGATMSGPVTHKWMGFMERFLPGSMGHNVASKIGLHTFVYAPFHLSVFNAWLAISEGHPELAAERVRKKTFPLWLAGTAFWVPIVIFNFRFVPWTHRVLVNNSANLVWTTYLSLKGPGAERQAATKDSSTVAARQSRLSKHWLLNFTERHLPMLALDLEWPSGGNLVLPEVARCLDMPDAAVPPPFQDLAGAAGAAGAAAARVLRKDPPLPSPGVWAFSVRPPGFRSAGALHWSPAESVPAPAQVSVCQLPVAQTLVAPTPLPTLMALKLMGNSSVPIGPAPQLPSSSAPQCAPNCAAVAAPSSSIGTPEAKPQSSSSTIATGETVAGVTSAFALAKQKFRQVFFHSGPSDVTCTTLVTSPTASSNSSAPADCPPGTALLPSPCSEPSPHASSPSPHSPTSPPLLPTFESLQAEATVRSSTLFALGHRAANDTATRRANAALERPNFDAFNRHSGSSQHPATWGSNIDIRQPGLLGVSPFAPRSGGVEQRTVADDSIWRAPGETGQASRATLRKGF